MQKKNMEKENKEQYRQQVLQELAAIGFARVGDCLKAEGDTLILKKLSGKAGAAIASIEHTSSGWKVKFYDKLKALVLLGKYMGMFAEDSSQEQSEESNLLECILQATEGAIDTDDIPEIQQAADIGHDLVEPANAEGV